MVEIDDNLLAQFHDPRLALPLVRRLQDTVIKEPLRLMHVCGTHEHALAKAGLRSLLPPHMRLVAGPGCPVCVCPAGDIDLALQACAVSKVILTTFGDMFRVPSGDTSLEVKKAEGNDIRVVYSPWDAVNLARQNPGSEVVFMAVGFETTAGPIAASLLDDPPPNFSIISSLRLVPPALRLLLDSGDGTLDGFILPGHVSTVLGRTGYLFLETEYQVPGVIAGFEPLDLLRGILGLVSQIAQGPPFRVENLYKRAVSEEGNRKARELMARIFQTTDSNWRGIGRIPRSGLLLREEYSRLDAVSKFGLKYNQEAVDVLPGCICHLVIMGEAESEDCPLFGKQCTPRRPFGPCMVSSEGTCRARYQYRTV
ncbi:MAG: hydrogenase formation protein HypD [Candidatus Krumholzibacteriota bacterium]|nr:hydrogenase formation protein HypD [Candidatus Krumholzibacteriota bacterium]